eukprot:Skav211532  [mRNA]  locus=scaffold352:395678:402022:- [translate_table: standard]
MFDWLIGYLGKERTATTVNDVFDVVSCQALLRLLRLRQAGHPVLIFEEIFNNRRRGWGDASLGEPQQLEVVRLFFREVVYNHLEQAELKEDVWDVLPEIQERWWDVATAKVAVKAALAPLQKAVPGTLAAVVNDQGHTGFPVSQLVGRHQKRRQMRMQNSFFDASTALLDSVVQAWQKQTRDNRAQLVCQLISMASASVAAPEETNILPFCIGSFKYHALPWRTYNDFPVFWARGQKDEDFWLFKRDDAEGFQCNYGEKFQGSRPLCRTRDAPWLVVKRCWEWFDKNTGEWKPWHVETTSSASPGVPSDGEPQSGLPVSTASVCGEQAAKRRRIEAKATPDEFSFYIGPKKDKRRYKYYAVPQLECGGFPVFRAEGQKDEDPFWLFKRDDDEGFQCNYGPEFETSTPKFRTLRPAHLPGKHAWEHFVKKSGEWTKCGDFETTHGSQVPSVCSNFSASQPDSAVDERRVVPVDDLRYSQWSISSSFSDGKSFQRLIDQLNAGELNPLNEAFLCLDAFILDGKIHSVDNRRLYCLKIHQQEKRFCLGQLFVRVRVLGDFDKTHPSFGLFYRLVGRCMVNGGKDIKTHWKR